jgi:hypothetical protein
MTDIECPNRTVGSLLEAIGGNDARNFTAVLRRFDIGPNGEDWVGVTAIEYYPGSHVLLRDSKVKHVSDCAPIGFIRITVSGVFGERNGCYKREITYEVWPDAETRRARMNTSEWSWLKKIAVAEVEY